LSAQAILRLAALVVTAQTISPSLKVVFAVVQSAAKVATAVTAGGGGKNAGNRFIEKLFDKSKALLDGFAEAGLILVMRPELSRSRVNWSRFTIDDAEELK